MNKLYTAARNYIFLSSFYQCGKKREKTPFDMNYKVYPAYIEIKYSHQDFTIIFEKEETNFSYSNIKSLKLSICGRHASIRQLYLLTLRMVMNTGQVLEIETYDYDEAILFFVSAKNNNVDVYEENQIIMLVKKYNKDIRGLYDYIYANAKVFFAEHPHDEKRISYLLKTNKINMP